MNPKILQETWKTLICLIITAAACIGAGHLMSIETLGIQVLGLFCGYTAVWVMVKSRFYHKFNFDGII